MYYFIGGPPTSGKSHLASTFAKDSGLDILHVKTDSLRNNIDNPELKKWVDFFRDQDEEKYWSNTSPLKHLENFVKQNTILWPSLLKEFQRLMDTHKHIIFEGVSILPNLARRDLNFDGLYLIPTDIESVYTRLLAHRRWGSTEKLKRIEAEMFFYHETPFFEKAARQYGYPVFADYSEAYNRLGSLFIK